MKIENLQDVDEKFLRIAAAFAKKKCKDCHSRGYQIFDNPPNPNTFIKHCHCVDKTRNKMNKAVK